MVNIILILIALKPNYCLENVENSISKHLHFKIFWGSMPPDPPRKLTPSALTNGLPPTFPVGMSTSKLTDSTDQAKEVHTIGWT